MSRMSAKKVRLNKVYLYGVLLSATLLIGLAGDGLQPAPAIAASPVTPMIAINPDDWQSLADAVSARADQFGGTVGYIIKDFRTGQVAETNSDVTFPSASLIKF